MKLQPDGHLVPRLFLSLSTWNLGESALYTAECLRLYMINVYLLVGFVDATEQAAIEVVPVDFVPYASSWPPPVRL